MSQARLAEELLQKTMSKDTGPHTERGSSLLKDAQPLLSRLAQLIPKLEQIASTGDKSKQTQSTEDKNPE